MKKRTKKWASLLLAGIMSLSMTLPATVSAAAAEDNDKSGYYLESFSVNDFELPAYQYGILEVNYYHELCYTL